MTNLRGAELLKKRRARLRQAGGVAVEGMIVVMMTTGIVLGMWFMREVFSGKLLTLTASRADAWQDSLLGCDSGNESKLYEKLHEQSKDPNANVCTDPNDCSTSNVDGLSDDGSSNPPPDWFPGGSGNEATKQLTVYSNSWSTTLVTSRKFSCNEKPSPELQLGSLNLLSTIADIAKKIPDEEVQEDTTAQTCWEHIGVPIKWRQQNCETNPCFKSGFGHVSCLHSFAQRRDLDIPNPPDDTKH